MYLNRLCPAGGAKKNKRRVGRGIGSGLGKTAGRGHKGQKSRAGGFHKVGFEGGQMPLQRRLPKHGFKSLSKPYKAQVLLSELNALILPTEDTFIDLFLLKQQGLVGGLIRVPRVILSGKVTKPMHLKGLIVTKGARAAIEAAGGSIVPTT